MIIDIKVDLSECYAQNFDSDCDTGVGATSSLSDEVAEVIRYEVKNAISQQIKDDVSRMTTKAYKEYGEKSISSVVDHEIAEFIRVGKVKAEYSNELVLVKDKLKKQVERTGWSPMAKMEELGKNFGRECRKRYDMAFASSIVTGLEKQGLLKPGVFEAITSQNSEG